MSQTFYNQKPQLKTTAKQLYTMKYSNDANTPKRKTEYIDYPKHEKKIIQLKKPDESLFRLVLHWRRTCPKTSDWLTIYAEWALSSELPKYQSRPKELSNYTLPANLTSPLRNVKPFITKKTHWKLLPSSCTQMKYSNDANTPKRKTEYIDCPKHDKNYSTQETRWIPLVSSITDGGRARAPLTDSRFTE